MEPTNELAFSAFHADFRVPDLIAFFASECDIDLICQSNAFAIAAKEKEFLPLDHSSMKWDDNSHDLWQCALEAWLPLPSSTQWIEALVKDAAFSINNGKEEASASSMSTIRSTMVPSVVARAKSDPEHHEQVCTHCCFFHFAVQLN